MNDPAWTRGKAKPKDQTIRNLPAACNDESKAVDLMEDLRWGDHPSCPRCACVEVRKMLGKDGKRNARFLWRCHGCKQQYTVRIGTVMEESLIPMRHWCYAFWRATTSKKGVAAKEIERQCQISYKSALYMMHRVRRAFKTDWTKPPKMSGTVECDEVYIGGKPRHTAKYRRGPLNQADIYKRKTPVVAMLQRDGDIRAVIVKRVDYKSIRRVLLRHINPKETRLHTDGAGVYKAPGGDFAAHEWVDHGAGEYARGDVTTNRVEGFFGIIRRGLHGIYHSVSPEHLDRYIHEFEWRYNHRKMSDGERIGAAVRASEGKRLFYKEPKGGAA